MPKCSATQRRRGITCITALAYHSAFDDAFDLRYYGCKVRMSQTETVIYTGLALQHRGDQLLSGHLAVISLHVDQFALLVDRTNSSASFVQRRKEPWCIRESGLLMLLHIETEQKRAQRDAIPATVRDH